MTITKTRCQIGLRAPGELIDGFQAAVREAGEVPSAIVRGFLNDYLVKNGGEPVEPEPHPIQHSLSRAFHAYAVAHLERGQSYDLSLVICEWMDLDPKEALDSTSRAYQRFAHALGQIRDDVVPLIEHGVETWQFESQLQLIEPGQSHARLAARLAQSGLNAVAQRFVRYCCGAGSATVSLTDTVIDMLYLEAERVAVLRSAEYHRMVRARAVIRKEKEALKAYGLSFSGRGDEIVTVKPQKGTL